MGSLKSKAPVASKVDPIAAAMKLLADAGIDVAKLGNATKRGPGRPKGSTKVQAFADTVEVLEGNTDMHYNVFFTLNDVSTRPNDETCELLSKHGYRFKAADAEMEAHWWGFKRMLPKEIAEADSRIDFHYES